MDTYNSITGYTASALRLSGTVLPMKGTVAAEAQARQNASTKLRTICTAHIKPSSRRQVIRYKAQNSKL